MQKGKFYEEKAVEFLILNGYRILERNFRSRFGEIDIIAKKSDYVSFIEVKAGTQKSFFLPREAVDGRKQSKIKKTALFYIARHQNCYYRFDVLEIVYGVNWRQYEFITDAFNMDGQ